MATYNDIKKIKIGDNTFVFHVPTATEVGALPSSTTIPAITLNGTANTSPSFYAPTTAGTNGYVLKSNGSGAPTWTSATLTDTKVTTAALTSGTLYYPILATGTGTATRQIDSTLKGLTYKSTAGTASAIGTAQLTIGNSTASGTANNEQGQIILYGSTAYAHTISGAPTAARTIVLPDEDGTFAINLSNLQDGSGPGSIQMSSADALKSYQIALGKYNLEDTGTDKDLSNFAFIIGNGTDANTRSNLFTINQSGLVSTHITPTEDYHWDLSIVDDAPPTPPGNRVGDQYFTGFEIRDAANNRVTHLDTHMTADGELRAVLGVERPIVPNWPDPTKTTASNQIYLGLDANGNRTCMVDAPDVFRYAIGLRDAITEKGTSGIWTYRKWSSGVAECWGVTTAQNYAITNTYGQGKYVGTSVNYPSGLFVDSPVVHISKYGGGEGLVWASVNNNTTTAVGFYVCDTLSHTVNCRFCIRAIGRWTSS